MKVYEGQDTGVHCPTKLSIFALSQVVQSNSEEPEQVKQEKWQGEQSPDFSVNKLCRQEQIDGLLVDPFSQIKSFRDPVQSGLHP